MQNCVIVTGGDARYYPMMAELVASIRALFPAGGPDIAAFDAGLEPGQIAELRAQGVLVKDFVPTAPYLEEPLRKRRVVTMEFAKMWLDQYFPDHETIICIDGDAWVQERSAVEMLYGAAQTGALAIVARGGAYRERSLSVEWLFGFYPRIGSFTYKNAVSAKLPRDIRNKVGISPVLNAGVFAMRREAPHWQRLRYWQERVLRHGVPFTSGQLSLALVRHIDGMPAELLPTSVNYDRKWKVNPETGKLVTFFYPYDPVGIVHMSDQKEVRFDPEATVEVPGTDGRSYRINLRFGHLQRSLAKAKAAMGAASA